ncbi:MAG: hypothetical protein GY804_15635 [Alphaproteobacteria bacterium]|nr:hypothetical protein [Alphaproteobacteria bacterium]
MNHTELLNKIVTEMIEKHKGGEVFFDNLDSKMRDRGIIDSLMELSVYEPYDTSFILSGKFGIHIKNTYPSLEMHLLVNGGLRKEKIISLEPFKHRIKGRSFVFLDDSFYLGRTRDAIQTEIEKWGGKIKRTYVCYDGSKEKDETVKSLYRYYDNHKVD